MKAIEEQLVAVTKDLVAFPSVTGDYVAAALVFDYISEYCKKHNLFIRSYENHGFRSFVVSLTETTSLEADILFHGHIDVIPAREKDFVPFVKENKLYGRGTLDMKGGLAVLLNLFADWSKEEHKKNVFLFITSDEETHGEYGTGYLLDEIGYHGKFFLTPEDARKYLIKVELKGVLHLKLLVKGTGGHGAYTWEGENAIQKLYRVYTDIEKLFPHNHDDPERWYTTINLGKVQGGHAGNAIPEYAEAILDVRFCGDWQTAEEIYEKIQEKIRTYSGVSSELLGKGSKVKTDTENYYVKTLHETAQEILQTQESLFFKNHATNDARFAAAVNIPAVGFGPIGDHAHAENEFVYIDSLPTFYTILKTFVERVFAIEKR